MRYIVLIVFLLFFFEVRSQEVIAYPDFERRFVGSDDTVYVVNFWATWCAPCVKELPAFEEAVKRYAGAKVRFYFLSLDFGTDGYLRANAFLQKRGYSFSSLLTTDENANSWIPMVSKSWSGAIPATLFIRNDVRLFHEGVMSASEISKNVDKLLN